jgi:hypothetical protein
LVELTNKNGEPCADTVSDLGRQVSKDSLGLIQ